MSHGLVNLIIALAAFCTGYGPATELTARTRTTDHEEAHQAQAVRQAQASNP